VCKNLLKDRDSLGLPSKITFGIEIEFVYAIRYKVRSDLFEKYLKKKLKGEWKLENDETVCDSDKIYSNYGGEAISDILIDTKDTWQDIKLVCDTIKSNKGKSNDKCGAHVHVGSNIFEDNLKYYARFSKLWTVYEDIIVRFCYGEDERARSMLYYYAASNRDVFKYIDLFYKGDKSIRSFDEFVKAYSTSKNLMVSFKGMDKEWIVNKYGNVKNWDEYRTLEYRGGNGTLNPVVWQNYVNLYTKIMLCCLDDSKNWDYVDKLFYDNIYNDNMLVVNDNMVDEFCNFIFDNDLDKYNFLVQYYKSELEFNNNLNRKVKMLLK
jgi:hypothetical protein